MSAPTQITRNMIRGIAERVALQSAIQTLPPSSHHVIELARVLAESVDDWQSLAAEPQLKGTVVYVSRILGASNAQLSMTLDVSERTLDALATAVDPSSKLAVSLVTAIRNGEFVA